MTHELDTIAQADALEYLRALPDGAVHAVICDPPYLTTHLAFDKTAIDWGVLIGECLRVVKPRGAVVMFAAMRTAVAMISAAPKYYRYDMVWAKTTPTGFPNAKRQPLRAHEHILVWSIGASVYHPVMGKGAPYSVQKSGLNITHQYDPTASNFSVLTESKGERYPISVLKFGLDNRLDAHHPTQKPLDLMEYLVKTYTRAGETVLDPFAGSGSTLVAARNLGRHYLGCDLDANYVSIAQRRLAEPYTPPLFPDEPAQDDAPAQLDMFGD